MDLEKLQQLANTPAQANSYSEGLAQAAIARANSHVARMRVVMCTAGAVLLVSAVAAFAVLGGGSKSENPAPNSVVSAQSTVVPTTTESAQGDAQGKTTQTPDSLTPSSTASSSPALSTPSPSKTSVAPGLPADVDSYDDEEDDGDLPTPSATATASDPTAPANDAATPVSPSQAPVPLASPEELPPVQPVAPLPGVPSATPSPVVPDEDSSPSVPRVVLPNPEAGGEELPVQSPFPLDPTNVGSDAIELIDRCTADDIKAESLAPEVDAEGQVTNAVRLQNVSGKPCWLVGVVNAKLSWGDTSTPLGSPAKLDRTLESGESLLVKVSYTAPQECLQATGTVTATISGLGDYTWPNSYLNECPAAS